MFCGNCGTKIAEDTRFCPECGANIAQQLASAAQEEASAESVASPAEQVPQYPQQGAVQQPVGQRPVTEPPYGQATGSQQGAPYQPYGYPQDPTPQEWPNQGQMPYQQAPYPQDTAPQHSSYPGQTPTPQSSFQQTLEQALSSLTQTLEQALSSLKAMGEKLTPRAKMLAGAAIVLVVGGALLLMHLTGDKDDDVAAKQKQQTGIKAAVKIQDKKAAGNTKAQQSTGNQEQQMSGESALEQELKRNEKAATKTGGKPAKNFNFQGKPTVAKFNWTRTGVPTGAKAVRAFSAIQGRWAAYVVIPEAGMTKLCTVNISGSEQPAKVTINWYQRMVKGNQPKPDNDPPFQFTGTFTGGVLAAKGSGTLISNSIVEKGGQQFFSGKIKWQSGETSTLYMVRP